MDLRMLSVPYSLSRPHKSVWYIRSETLVNMSFIKKEFTADMKNIYNASNKEVAAAELDNLDEKWGGKYPYAILSWKTTGMI